MVPLIVLFSVLFFFLGLVIYGTITKNRWGVNLESVKCPRCGAPLPEIRLPKSFRQTLWGGLTCASCGTEVDKWGRAVGQVTNAPIPRQ
jgi:hypothetical protein